MVGASPTSRGFELLTLNAYVSANSEPIDFEFSPKFAEKFGLSFGLLGEVLTIWRLVRLRILRLRKGENTLHSPYQDSLRPRSDEGE